MKEFGKESTQMPGAAFGQDRKSSTSFNLPESSESEPPLQVKLKKGPPLATCISEIVLLPILRETNSLTLDCSFAADEKHGWLARGMVTGA